MTDKELRKLKRSELLELMFYMREELDRTQQENDELKARLDSISQSAVSQTPELPEATLQAITAAVEHAVQESLSPNKDSKKRRGKQKAGQAGTEQ